MQCNLNVCCTILSCICNQIYLSISDITTLILIHIYPHPCILSRFVPLTLPLLTVLQHHCTVLFCTELYCTCYTHTLVCHSHSLTVLYCTCHIPTPTCLSLSLTNCTLLYRTVRAIGQAVERRGRDIGALFNRKILDPGENSPGEKRREG